MHRCICTQRFACVSEAPIDMQSTSRVAPRLHSHTRGGAHSSRESCTVYVCSRRARARATRRIPEKAPRACERTLRAHVSLARARVCTHSRDVYLWIAARTRARGVHCITLPGTHGNATHMCGRTLTCTWAWVRPPARDMLMSPHVYIYARQHVSPGGRVGCVFCAPAP